MSEAPVAEPVAPEVDISPAPEAPVNNTPETPETPDTPAPATPEGPDDVAIYQDVVAKYNEDPNYQMSDTESDAFLAVQDRINSKAMKEPEPKKLGADKPAEPNPEKDEKPAEDQPENDSNKPEAEDKPEADNDEAPADSVNKSMMESMKKVGAKDVTELPDKIDSLIRNRDESGGRLGSENAALKTKVADMEKAQNNHIAWLEALKKGDASAVKYLHEQVGYTPNSQPVAPAANDNSGPAPELDLDSDEGILDENLAKYVKGMQGQMKSLQEKLDSYETKDKAREEANLTQKATAGWVDDVVSLVTDDANKEFFGLSGKEARGLSEYYFSDAQKDQPVNPKFQRVHELILFAYENQMPNLEAAHVVHQHKSGHFARQLVNATKNGQQDFKPSVNTDMSDKQSRGNNNVPDPSITDDSVSRMESGDFDTIPDEWINPATGNLDPAKVPKRFHERAFGRVMPT